MNNWQEFCFSNLPQAIVVMSEDYQKIIFVNQRARYLFFLQNQDEFHYILDNLQVVEVRTIELIVGCFRWQHLDRGEDQ